MDTVDHSRDEFASGAVHGSFRGFAKIRLAKFKGLPRRTFHLHLKETEWRYNHADRYEILIPPAKPAQLCKTLYKNRSVPDPSELFGDGSQHPCACRQADSG